MGNLAPLGVGCAHWRSRDQVSAVSRLGPEAPHVNQRLSETSPASRPDAVQTNGHPIAVTDGADGGVPVRAPLSAQPQQPINALALTGFLCSLFGILPIALPLGILGLRQINRGRGSGKGLAIAAIVLSACGALVIGAIVALALASGPSRDPAGAILAPERISLYEARPGDCVTEVAQDGRDVYTVPVASCDQPHRAEVVGVFELRSGPWPGELVAANASAGRCTEALQSASKLPKRLVEPFWYGPTKESWELGDRGVACLALFREPRTGLLREGAIPAGPGRAS